MTRLLSTLALLGTCALPTLANADLADARQTLRVGDTERSYVLRLPPPRKDEKPVPLVMVLHGGGGNADYAEHMTGFTQLAMREGFAVAYPEGSSRFKGKLLTWNAAHCCGYAMVHRIHDVAFIDALLDTLLAGHRIDPRRVYVTGISNGGMMAHRLGIELSHRFAAIAPVAATLFGDEKSPAQPVAALMINGELDRSVPFAGGPPGGRFAYAWDGMPTQAASAQARFWANANQCTSAPQITRDGTLTRSDYHCPDGRQVSLLTLSDNGHAWPSGKGGSPLADVPSTAIDASEVIWEFFRQHAKARK